MTARAIRAFFGGAFDPVHFGHIKPTLELAMQPQVEQVRFVPCGHQHPEVKCMAPAAHRVRMLELVQTTPATAVEQCAVNDDALCYTVDLMDHLRGVYGSHTPLAFVLGYDSYLNLPSWKRADELREKAHLIVFSRVTDSAVSDSDGADLDALTQAPGGLTHFFDNSRYDISSTQVRDGLRSGRAPRGLLPGTVWNYIRRNHLYGVH